MRIRSVKPEFWTDEKLSTVSEPARLLALGLLNYADDEGYFQSNPALITAALCPLRAYSVPIPELLIELSVINFVKIYQRDDGKLIGHVCNFLRHQKVNRPNPSKLKQFMARSVILHGAVTPGMGKGIGMGRGSGFTESGERPKPALSISNRGEARKPEAQDWQARAAGERDDQVPSPGEDFVVLDPAEHAPDPDDLVDQPARPSPERQAPVIETPVLKTRLGVLAADWPTTRLDTDQLRADWQAATEGLTRSAIAAIMDGKPCRYPSEFTPRREAWEESKRGERAAVAMNDQTARAKAEHARRVQASAQADQDSLPIAQAMLAQIDADPTVLHGQEARITARVESLRKLVAQGKSSSLMLHAIWLACPILKPDAFPGEAQQASQA